MSCLKVCLKKIFNSRYPIIISISGLFSFLSYFCAIILVASTVIKYEFVLFLFLAYLFILFIWTVISDVSIFLILHHKYKSTRLLFVMAADMLLYAGTFLSLFIAKFGKHPANGLTIFTYTGILWLIIGFMDIANFGVPRSYTKGYETNKIGNIISEFTKEHLNYTKVNWAVQNKPDLDIFIKPNNINDPSVFLSKNLIRNLRQFSKEKPEAFLFIFSDVKLHGKKTNLWQFATLGLSLLSICQALWSNKVFKEFAKAFNLQKYNHVDYYLTCIVIVALIIILYGICYSLIKESRRGYYQTLALYFKQANVK